MKTRLLRLIAVAISFFILQNVHGQWTRTGTVVHLTNAGDNVGVGTANPGTGFHLLDKKLLQETSTDINNFFTLKNGSNGVTWSMKQMHSTDQFAWNSLVFEFDDGTTTQRKFQITDAGNVGIGVNRPGAQLDVLGNIKFSKMLMANGVSGSANQILKSQGWDQPAVWTDISTLLPPNNDWHLGGNSGTLETQNYIGTSDSNGLLIKTNHKGRIRVTANGHVGIGHMTPANNTQPVEALDVYTWSPDLPGIWPYQDAVVRIQSAPKDGNDFGPARLEFWSDPRDHEDEWRPSFIESTDGSLGSFSGGMRICLSGTGKQQKTDVNEKISIQSRGTGFWHRPSFTRIPYAAPDGVRPPLNRVEIDDGRPMSPLSGLRLTDLAGAFPLPSNGMTLSVNAFGDVILTKVCCPDTGGWHPPVMYKEEDISMLRDELTDLKRQNKELVNYINLLICQEATPTASLTQGTVLDIRLLQNQPNPFAESTEISYSVPLSASMAQLVIFNMTTGVQTGKFDLPSGNPGTLTLESKDMPTGVYNYSLIVDGKTVITKKMIVIK